MSNSGDALLVQVPAAQKSTPKERADFVIVEKSMSKEIQKLERELQESVAIINNNKAEIEAIVKAKSDVEIELEKAEHLLNETKTLNDDLNIRLSTLQNDLAETQKSSILKLSVMKEEYQEKIGEIEKLVEEQKEELIKVQYDLEKAENSLRPSLEKIKSLELEMSKLDAVAQKSENKLRLERLKDDHVTQKRLEVMARTNEKSMLEQKQFYEETLSHINKEKTILEESIKKLKADKDDLNKTIDSQRKDAEERNQKYAKDEQALKTLLEEENLKCEQLIRDQNILNSNLERMKSVADKNLLAGEASIDRIKDNLEELHSTQMKMLEETHRVELESRAKQSSKEKEHLLLEITQLDKQIRELKLDKEGALQINSNLQSRLMSIEESLKLSQVAVQEMEANKFRLNKNHTEDIDVLSTQIKSLQETNISLQDQMASQLRTHQEQVEKELDDITRVHRSELESIVEQLNAVKAQKSIIESEHMKQLSSTQAKFERDMQKLTDEGKAEQNSLANKITNLSSELEKGKEKIKENEREKNAQIAILKQDLEQREINLELQREKMENSVAFVKKECDLSLTQLQEEHERDLQRIREEHKFEISKALEEKKKYMEIEHNKEMTEKIAIYTKEKIHVDEALAQSVEDVNDLKNRLLTSENQIEQIQLVANEKEKEIEDLQNQLRILKDAQSKDSQILVENTSRFEKMKVDLQESKKRCEMAEVELLERYKTIVSLQQEIKQLKSNAPIELPKSTSTDKDVDELEFPLDDILEAYSPSKKSSPTQKMSETDLQISVVNSADSRIQQLASDLVCLEKELQFSQSEKVKACTKVSELQSKMETIIKEKNEEITALKESLSHSTQSTESSQNKYRNEMDKLRRKSITDIEELRLKHVQDLATIKRQHTDAIAKVSEELEIAQTCHQNELDRLAIQKAKEFAALRVESETTLKNMREDFDRARKQVREEMRVANSDAIEKLSKDHDKIVDALKIQIEGMENAYATEKEKITDDINEHKKELMKLKLHAEASVGEHEALMNERDILLKKLEISKSVINERQKCIIDLEKQLEEGLEELKQEKLQHKQDMDKELTEYKKEIAEIEGRLSREKEVSKTASSKLRKMNETLESTQQQLLEYKNELNKKESKLSDLVVHCNSLDEMTEKYKSDLELAAEKLLVSENEFKTMKRDLSEIQEERRNHEEVLKTKNEEHQSTLKQIENFEKDRKEMTETIHNMKILHASALASLEESKNSELQEILNELDMKKVIFGKFKEKVKTLKKSLAESNVNLEASKANLKTCQKQIDTMREVEENLYRELDAHKKERESLKLAFGSERKEVERLNQEMISLKNENDNITFTVNSYRHDKDSLAKQVEVLEKKVEQHVNSLKDSFAEKETHRMDAMATREKLDGVKEEKNGLERKLEDLEKDKKLKIDIFVKQIEDLKFEYAKKIDKTTQKIEDLESNHANKQVETTEFYDKIIRNHELKIENLNSDLEQRSLDAQKTAQSLADLQEKFQTLQLCKSKIEEDLANQNREKDQVIQKLQLEKAEKEATLTDHQKERVRIEEELSFHIESIEELKSSHSKTSLQITEHHSNVKNLLEDYVSDFSNKQVSELSELVALKFDSQNKQFGAMKKCIKLTKSKLNVLFQNLSSLSDELSLRDADILKLRQSNADIESLKFSAQGEALEFKTKLLELQKSKEEEDTQMRESMASLMEKIREMESGQEEVSKKMQTMSHLVDSTKENLAVKEAEAQHIQDQLAVMKSKYMQSVDQKNELEELMMSACADHLNVAKSEIERIETLTKEKLFKIESRLLRVHDNILSTHEALECNIGDAKSLKGLVGNILAQAEKKFDEERSTYRNEKNALATKLERSTSEIDRLNKVLSSNWIDLENVQEQYKALSTELSAEKGKYDQIKDIREQENSTFLFDKKKLNESLTHTQKELETLNVTHNQLTASYTILVEHLSDANVLIKDLESNINKNAEEALRKQQILQNEVEQLHAQLVTSDKGAEEFKLTINDLRQENLFLVSKNKGHEDALTTYKSIVETLKEESKSAENSLNELSRSSSNRINQLQEELESLKSEFRLSVEEKDKISKEKEAVDNTVRTLYEEIDVLKKEAQHLCDENLSLKEDINALDESKMMHVEQISVLRSELEAQTSSLTAKESECANSLIKIREQAIQIETSEKTLTDTKNDLLAANEKLHASVSDVAAFRVRIAQLEEIVKTKNELLEEVTVQKSQLFEQKLLTDEAHAATKETVSIREAELESHKKQSQEQEKTHLKTVEEIKLGYQEATRTLQAAARENERAYSALELRYQQQIEESTTVISKYNNLKFSSDEMKASFEKILLEKEALLVELGGAKTEVISLKKDYKELDTRLQELQEKLIDMKEKNGFLEKQISETTEENDKLKEMCSTLENNLDSTSNQLSTLAEKHEETLILLHERSQHISALKNDAENASQKIFDLTESSEHISRILVDKETELAELSEIRKTVSESLEKEKMGHNQTQEALTEFKDKFEAQSKKLSDATLQIDSLVKEREAQWDETSRLVAEKDLSLKELQTTLDDEMVKMENAKLEISAMEQRNEDLKLSLQQEIVELNKALEAERRETVNLKQAIERTQSFHNSEQERYEAKISGLKQAEEGLHLRLTAKDESIANFETHIEQMNDEIIMLQKIHKETLGVAEQSKVAVENKLQDSENKNTALAEQIESEIKKNQNMALVVENLRFDSSRALEESENEFKRVLEGHKLDSDRSVELLKTEIKLKHTEMESLQSELSAAKEYNTKLIAELHLEAESHQNALAEMRENLTERLNQQSVANLESKIEDIKSKFYKEIIPAKLLEEQGKHLREVERVSLDYEDKLKKTETFFKNLAVRRASVSESLRRKYSQSKIEDEVKIANASMTEKIKELQKLLDTTVFERDELREENDNNKEIINHQKEMLRNFSQVHKESLFQVETMKQKHSIMADFVQSHHHLHNMLFYPAESSESPLSGVFHEDQKPQLKKEYLDILRDAQEEMEKNLAAIDRVTFSGSKEEHETYIELAHNELHEEHANLLVEGAEFENTMKTVNSQKTQAPGSENTKLIVAEEMPLIEQKLRSYKTSVDKFKKRHYVVAELIRQKHLHEIEKLRAEHDNHTEDLKRSHSKILDVETRSLVEHISKAKQDHAAGIETAINAHNEAIKEMKVQHHTEIRKLKEEISSIEISKTRELAKANETHAEIIESAQKHHDLAISELHTKLENLKTSNQQERLKMQKSSQESLDEQAKSYGKIVAAMNVKLEQEKASVVTLQKENDDILAKHREEIAFLKEKHSINLGNENNSRDAQLFEMERMLAESRQREELHERAMVDAKSTVDKLNDEISQHLLVKYELNEKVESLENIVAKTKNLYNEARAQVGESLERERKLKLENENYVKALKSELSKGLKDREIIRSDFQNLKDAMHKAEIEFTKTKQQWQTEKTTELMEMQSKLETKDIEVKRLLLSIEGLKRDIQVKDEQEKKLENLSTEKSEHEKRRLDELQKYLEVQSEEYRQKISEIHKNNEIEKAQLLKSHETLLKQANSSHLEVLQSTSIAHDELIAEKESNHAKNVKFLKDEIEKHKLHMNKMQEAIAAKNSERQKELVNSLNENFERERCAFQKQLEEAGKLKNHLGNECSTLKEELLRLKKVVEEKENSVFENKQIAARLEVQSQSLEEELNLREKAMTGLRESIGSMKSKFALEMEDVHRDYEIRVEEEKERQKSFIENLRLSLSSEIKSLENAKSVLSAEKLDLEQNVASLLTHVEELKFKLTQNASQLEDYEDSNAQNESKLAKLKSEIIFKDKSIEEKDSKIQTLKEECAEQARVLIHERREHETLLQKKAFEHEKILEACRREAEKLLSRTIHDHKEEKTTLSKTFEESQHVKNLETSKLFEKITLLEDDCAAKDDALVRLKEDLIAHHENEMNQKMEIQNNAFQEAEKDHANEVANLNSVIEKLKQQQVVESVNHRSSLEKELHLSKVDFKGRIEQKEAVYRDEINRIETKCASDIKLLNEKLSAAQTRTRQLIRKMADAESAYTERLEKHEAEKSTTLSSYREKHESLQREIDALKSKLDIATDKVQKLSIENEEIREGRLEDLQSMEDQIHTLNKDLDEARSSLTTWKTKYNESSKENQQLKEAVVKNTAAVETLEKELTDSQRVFEAKQARMREKEIASKNQYTQLKQETDKLYKDKQEAYEAIEERLQTLKTAHENTVQKFTDKVNSETQLKKQVGHLTSELEQCRAEVETLQHSIELRDVEITSLKSTVAHLETEVKNHAESTSSVLEESRMKNQAMLEEFKEREKNLVDIWSKRVDDKNKEINVRVKELAEEHKQVIKDLADAHRKHVESMTETHSAALESDKLKSIETVKMLDSKIANLTKQLENEEEANDKLRSESAASRKIIIRLKSKLEEKKIEQEKAMECKIRDLHEEHSIAMAKLFAESDEKQIATLSSVENERAQTIHELRREVENIRLQAEVHKHSFEDEAASTLAAVQDEYAIKMEQFRQKVDHDRVGREEVHAKEMTRLQADFEYQLGNMRADHEHALAVQNNLMEQRILATKRQMERALIDQEKLLQLKHTRNVSAAVEAHILSNKEEKIHSEYEAIVSSLRGEIKAHEEEKESKLQQIKELEHTLTDIRNQLERKEEELTNEQSLRRTTEEAKGKSNVIIERLKGEITELNLQVGKLKSLLESKEAQLNQFRIAESAKEAKHEARFQASKNAIEDRYRKRAEEHRIELAKAMKKQVEKIQMDKAAWKDDFESQIVAQMKTATSEYVSQNEIKVKELQSQVDTLSKANRVLVEKQHIMEVLEVKYKSLKQENEAIKTNMAAGENKRERELKRLVADKDESIEQLLTQLKEHNGLLQEMHLNLQGEQQEKESLSAEIHRLQSLLNGRNKTNATRIEMKTEHFPVVAEVGSSFFDSYTASNVSTAQINKPTTSKYDPGWV